MKESIVPSTVSGVTNRVLNSSKSIKPIDFGKAGLCGSIDALGRIQALNAYHPQQGFVGLTTAHSFPLSERYNQQAVRQYRSSLAEIAGFGPQFEKTIISKITTLLGNAIPEVELIFADGSKAVMTVIACEQGIVQRWQFTHGSPVWSGHLSVQRAAYTQLTEGGPLPDITDCVEFRFEKGQFTLTQPNLPCTAIVSGFPIDTPEQRLTTDHQIEIRVSMQPNSSAEEVSRQSEALFISYAIAENPDIAKSHSQFLEQYCSPEQFHRLLEQEAQEWQQYLSAVPDDLVLQRGLVYARMLSIPVTEDTVCIITDHRLLPLSWNRDAYFVAIALLQWGKPHWELVRKHLVWMFEVADRGEGNEWGRCYLINGQLKDKAYQLDQQLFPLLELADYVLCSGDQDTFERLHQYVQPLVDRILSRKHKSVWLFPTDETPGDDPLAYKYHFSSHVLMWHTFRTLEKLLPGCGYQEIAEAIHQDTQVFFIAGYKGQQMYAYACDAKGHYLFYHDANDVLLALMPEWGFVSKDDAVWQATVKFAFSPDNQSGYFDTNRLGSVHTPAPWPLGDIQKLIIARELDQPDMAEEALLDIHSAAQWDGGLPEAYNANDFSVRSRHWFAWPNALYVMAQLPPIKK